MRLSGGFVLVTALALVSSLAGCFKAEFGRDGAGCSEEGTCPPGQVCSIDGQCLFPCPIPDCAGAECGCKSHLDDEHTSEPSGGYLCLADGLCHLKCLEYGGCPGNLVCGANGLCLPRCGDSQGCPNGAVCREVPNSDSYCQGGDLDGGVVGDGGICTECPNVGCVFLDRDPANCGNCGHDCQFGDCVGGRCQPRVVAYGPELSGGAAMTIAGEVVYWTVLASQGVYACQRPVCESPTLLCVGPACGKPTALAVSASAVYWIDEHDGDARILSCPLGGCTTLPTVVAEGLGRATALAYDGSLLYFSSSGGLKRCPEVDCESYVQPIHSVDLSTDTVSLAVGEDEVVWTSFADGAVRQCPKTGCASAPTVLVEEPDSFPGSVTIDSFSGYVYWLVSGLGEVQRCPLTGCDPAPETVASVASGEPDLHLSTLAVLPYGVLVVDSEHTLRHCVYGMSCDALGLAGSPVWTTVTTSSETAIFGVADGRILELALLW